MAGDACYVPCTGIPALRLPRLIGEVYVGKIATWDRYGNASRPIFETASTSWIEVHSDVVDIPRDGLYTVRWAVDLVVTETYALGYLNRRSWDFEFRIEFGGVYAYSYRPATMVRFEPSGYVSIPLSAGLIDGYVLMRVPQRTAARVNGFLIEVLDFEDGLDDSR